MSQKLLKAYKKLHQKELLYSVFIFLQRTLSFLLDCVSARTETLFKLGDFCRETNPEFDLLHSYALGVSDILILLDFYKTRI